MLSMMSDTVLPLKASTMRNRHRFCSRQVGQMVAAALKRSDQTRTPHKCGRVGNEHATQPPPINLLPTFSLR